MSLSLVVKDIIIQICPRSCLSFWSSNFFSFSFQKVTKLAELYKESSDEWSKKAGELEGVIKALEVISSVGLWIKSFLTPLLHRQSLLLMASSVLFSLFADTSCPSWKWVQRETWNWSFSQERSWEGFTMCLLILAYVKWFSVVFSFDLCISDNWWILQF